MDNINIIIVIPTYEPDEKLINTLNSMRDAGFKRLIVVNDGSGSRFEGIIDRLKKEHPSAVVLSYGENRGKGFALKTAFDYIAKNEKDYIGAVTVDGDGQHLPEDVVRVAERLAEDDGKVIIGCRDFDDADVPKKSKTGHNIVNAALKILFGITSSDSQSGLRGIPAALIPAFASEIDGNRYDYETVMFIYMKMHGISFDEVKIKALYEDGNKETHYRALVDSIRVARSVIHQLPIVKQMISSVTCFIVDTGLFRLLDAVLPAGSAEASIARHLFFATAISRVLSSTLNYTINRLYVFRSKASVGASFIKYAVLAAIQMTLAWLGITGLTLLTGVEGFPRTLLKIAVDACLFTASYFVQKKWVFKNGR
ncbi:MAG: bifunctional glycosyltransferase family 2/GtrA family protein [Lachnospiraceae bacterium]|nr:bifunctional glycosyltransferase family 2/GtrA family protein [Lachnospiraceae bacterium]